MVSKEKIELLRQKIDEADAMPHRASCFIIRRTMCSAVWQEV